MKNNNKSTNSSQRFPLLVKSRAEKTDMKAFIS